MKLASRALAALALVLALPAAADRDVRIDRPRPAEPPTVVITPAEGRAFRIVLSPVWPTAPGDELPDAIAIRELMEVGAKAAWAASKEADIALRELKGAQAFGTYFAATDRAPAPGGLPHLVQGLVRLGDICVAFRIYSGGEAAVVERAIRMVGAMRNG